MKRVHKELYAEDDEEVTEELELPGVMSEEHEHEQEPLVSRFITTPVTCTM